MLPPALGRPSMVESTPRTFVRGVNVVRAEGSVRLRGSAGLPGALLGRLRPLRRRLLRLRRCRAVDVDVIRIALAADNSRSPNEEHGGDDEHDDRGPHVETQSEDDL